MRLQLLLMWDPWMESRDKARVRMIEAVDDYLEQVETGEKPIKAKDVELGWQVRRPRGLVQTVVGVIVTRTLTPGSEMSRVERVTLRVDATGAVYRWTDQEFDQAGFKLVQGRES